MRQTVLGVYDSYANARSAQRALEAGMAQADIAIYSTSVDAPREKGPRVYVQGAVDTRHHRKVFDRLEQLFARIFTKGSYPPDAEDYREFMRRGGTIVSADVSEAQVDQALEVMLRAGAADIEECATAWRPAASNAQSPEHAAPSVSAMADELARQNEATRGRQGNTPAASAVRTTPATVTPAAAIDDMQGTAFSSTDPNLRQVSTRTEGRGPTPPIGKPSYATDVSRAGFARTNQDAGVKSHTAQASDGNPPAPKARRSLATGNRDEPGRLGTPQDDADWRESEFRRDYDARYANTGASYDEHRRGYPHEATLGRDERYRGADWQGVEADARAKWEARNPESAWERFKMTVRRGWERVSRGV
ncbi:hypothetical protein PWR63_29900 [Paraburkholderia sp. A2WS-5]|uniref:hypothetical protein n=1 Tax=unclassified Paraburkholderia TaxID=2615204 RepID=UPI003B77E1D6